MKEAGPPPPLRNVTSAEILGILGQENFTPPDSTIDKETWDAIVQKVRGVVKELDLDLVLKSDPRVRMRENVCKPIDQLITQRKHKEELALQGDHMVSVIRKEIGNRLAIRLSLGAHSDFQKLLALIKRTNGKLYRNEIGDEVSKTIVQVMHHCVKEFGDTPERRRIGYDCIAAFLSEQAGIPVSFENLVLYDKSVRRQPSRPYGPEGVKRTRKKEPGPLGDLEDEARKLTETKDMFHQVLGEFLLRLGTKAANIGTEIGALGREKASLVSELGPINAELGPIEAAKRRIDDAAEGLRQALVVIGTRRNSKIDTQTIQIPGRQRRAFDLQKRALEASAADQYREKARLEREIDLLERKIQALTALQGLLPNHQLRLEQVLEILARLEMLPGRAATPAATPGEASAAHAHGASAQAAPAAAQAAPAAAPARSSAPPIAPGLAANLDRDEDAPEIPEKITTIADLEILSRRGTALKLQATVSPETHRIFSGAHVKRGGLSVGTIVQFGLTRVRGQLVLRSLLNENANVIPLTTDAAVARLGLSVIRQMPSQPSAPASRSRAHVI